MDDRTKEQVKELLFQLTVSADAGTVAEDYGTQGLALVLRRIYYLVDHAA